MSDPIHWMQKALQEASRARAAGEVPVGCVLVDAENREIARGRNRKEFLKDPTAHAEILALRAASLEMRSWRLVGTTLYVTLEPCAMCAGAMVQARVSRVVYGCLDPKAGAIHSLFGIGVDPRLNHRFQAEGGLLANECAQILSDFFQQLRAGKRESAI